MFKQVEVVVFAKVSSQVEGVQCITVFVVVASDADDLVRVQFARTREQRVVGTHKLIPLEIGLNQLQHVLLLSIQIDGNLQEVTLFKV